jgi:hypothetical protein
MVVVVIVGHFMLLDVRLDGCTILGWMMVATEMAARAEAGILLRRRKIS